MITTGSDCTGLAVCSFALRILKAANPLRMKVRHVFACDILLESEVITRANFGPDIHWFPTVFSTEFLSAPYVDCFCAGFPCQPFSSMSTTAMGEDDPAGRGTVTSYLLQYVLNRKPRMCLFENVTGLLTKFPETLLRFLTALMDAGYNVSWKTLNSHQVGAVPQTRNRIYIVAVLKSFMTGCIGSIWPSAIPPLPLHAILDPHRDPPGALPSGHGGRMKVLRVLNMITRLNMNPSRIDAVVDAGSIQGRMTSGRIPCLTRTRASGGGFWIISHRRMMTPAEMMRSQGLRPTDVCGTEHMSARTLGSMLGNSFTCTVVVRLFCKLLPLSGLVSGPLHDPVARESYSVRRIV